MQDLGGDVSDWQPRRQRQQLAQTLVLLAQRLRLERGHQGRIPEAGYLGVPPAGGLEQGRLPLEREERRDHGTAYRGGDRRLHRGRRHPRGDGQDQADDENERFAA